MHLDLSQSRRLRRWQCCVGLLLVCAASLATAQENADYIKPVPILTGSAGFITSMNSGTTELKPVFMPVVLVPIGNRFLVEGRAIIDGKFEQVRGSSTNNADAELQYMQLDYIANRYVTLSAGRFLNPFGLYNERLYPIWIRNLQFTPLIFPIATGSSDGVMARGGFGATSRINLTYAAYFSALSTVSNVESDRLFGGRFGVFLPQRRIEVGFSVQHLLQEDRSNALGFHAEWQPLSTPFDMRAEYARSSLGSGYWVESAYRLSGLSQKSLHPVQLVARLQQFFPGHEHDAAEEYNLPDGTARQVECGVNYFLRDGMKATASLGRLFTSDGDSSVWTVGFAYRFALPLGRPR